MKVKDLLTDESKWTKTVIAADEKNNPCGARDSKACRFCLLGAIYNCYDAPKRQRITFKVKRQLAKKGRFKNIQSFNDSSETTFEDVRKLVNELDI